MNNPLEVSEGRLQRSLSRFRALAKELGFEVIIGDYDHKDTRGWPPSTSARLLYGHRIMLDGSIHSVANGVHELAHGVVVKVDPNLPIGVHSESITWIALERMFAVRCLCLRAWYEVTFNWGIGGRGHVWGELPERTRRRAYRMLPALFAARVAAGKVDAYV